MPSIVPELVRTIALVLIAASLAPASALARPKTDVVVLDNGNRVSCEMLKLRRGKLTVKTDAYGTVDIKWSRITGLESEYYFLIELDSGVRYMGRIALGESGKIEIPDGDEPAVLEIPQIVGMVAVESSFWSRWAGSVDAGYDFTQATSATSWSSSAELEYRTPRFEMDLSFSSNVQEQTGAEQTNRQNLGAIATRYYEKRWFAAILGQAEKSANTGLDFRGLMGGSGGRKLVQTNRSNVSVLAGAAFSREKFEDAEDFDSNVELVGAVLAETFRFDSPELDLSAQAAIYPNLMTAGRYRVQASGKAKIEIVKNLYWSLSVYESYDSDPPSETSRKNDFGITTSIGWSFN
jgi:hypothetical protein